MMESIDIFYNVVVPAFSKRAKGFFAPEKLHFLSGVMSIISMNNYDTHVSPRDFRSICQTGGSRLRCVLALVEHLRHHTHEYD